MLTQELERRSNLLDAVLSCLPDSVFFASPDGTIQYTNSMAQKMFGYTAETLRGGDLGILFTPEDMDLLYPNLLHLACTENSVSEEVMLLRRNGARFMALVHMSQYSQPDGSILIVVIEDIDQEKQLKALFQNMGYDDLVKVTNGVGHEIRNPLMVIGGYLRKMYTSCKTTDEDDAYYQCIIENLTKIESVVRKVEFFTTPPKPSFAPISTLLVVESALKTFEKELNTKQVRCVVDVEPVSLPMDLKLMIRAVTILVENALEAMTEQDELRITGQKGDDFFVFCIQDNGAGISPTDLPFIFHPFFSTRQHSAGIDLTILKRIIESHHGRVEVSSEVGQGTKFDLFLPLERRRRIRRMDLSAGTRPKPKRADA